MAESALDLYKLASQQLADKNASNPLYALSGGVQKGIDQEEAQRQQVRQLQLANQVKLQQDQAEFEQRRKQIDIMNATQNTNKPVINTIFGRATRNIDNPTYADTKVIKVPPANAAMSLVSGAYGTVNGTPIPEMANTTVEQGRTQDLYSSATQTAPQSQGEPRYSMGIDGKIKDNQDDIEKLKLEAAKVGVDGTGMSRATIIKSIADKQATANSDTVPEGFEVVGYNAKGNPIKRKITVSPTLQRQKNKDYSELQTTIEENKARRQTIEEADQALKDIPKGLIGKAELSYLDQFDPNNPILEKVQKVKAALTDAQLLYTARTKGAISDREMELFQAAAANNDFNSTPRIRAVFTKLLRFIDADERAKINSYKENYNEDVQTNSTTSGTTSSGNTFRKVQ